MSVIFMDGFDWLDPIDATTGATLKYIPPLTELVRSDDTRYGVGFSIDNSVGSNSIRTMPLNPHDAVGAFGTANSPQGSNSLTLGCAIKFLSADAEVTILIGYNTLDWNFTALFHNMSANTGSSPTVSFNGTDTLGGAGQDYGVNIPTALILNKWYWLEYKVVADGTAGVVELRIDGDVVFTFSGQVGISTVGWYSVGVTFAGDNASTPNGSHWLIDDLVVIANDGLGVTGYPGDSQVLVANLSSDIKNDELQGLRNDLPDNTFPHYENLTAPLDPTAGVYNPTPVLPMAEGIFETEGATVPGSVIREVQLDCIWGSGIQGGDEGPFDPAGIVDIGLESSIGTELMLYDSMYAYDALLGVGDRIQYASSNIHPDGGAWTMANFASCKVKLKLAEY